MKLNKANDRIDWKAMWDVLNMYGVSGKSQGGVKAFYTDTKVKVEGEYMEVWGKDNLGCSVSLWIEMKEKLKQKWVMSEWKCV